MTEPKKKRRGRPRKHPPKTPEQIEEGKRRQLRNLIPFKPGKSGNPGGKTKEQRELEIANAERATRIRAKMLAALDAIMAEEDGQIDAATIPEILGAITNENLRLLKEAEDRGLGQAEQVVTFRDDDKPDEMLLREIEKTFRAAGVEGINIELLIGQEGVSDGPGEGD